MQIVGRYALHSPIASGGMGTVYLGRLVGAAGFGRTVAIKAMLPSCAADPDFVSMFLDEARLAARVQHPNVVQTLDVVHENGSLILVMEYAHGESLSKLTRGGARIPVAIATAIACDVLDGLHAAHEARDGRGELLGIVHRDVSPQNVLVTVEGVSKVLDFGVAKAKGRLHTTRDGQVKGKLAYMPPEQFHGDLVDRRADVFAAAVVFWEMLTGQRLFAGDTEAATVGKILAGEVTPARAIDSRIPPALDAVVMRALARDPNHRFATAHEMARAVEDAMMPARRAEVAEWLKSCASNILDARSSSIYKIERESGADFGAEAARVIAQVSQATPLSGVHVGAAHPEPGAMEHSAAPIHSNIERAPTHGLLLWLLAGVFASVSAIALVLLFRAGLVRRDVGHPVTSVASLASDTPIAEPPPPAPSASEVAASASASASGAASAAPSTATPVASGALRPASRTNGLPATGSGAHDCTNPCSFDARGVKVCKVECLQ